MVKFEGVGIEIKTGIIFGLTGFFLSFITGFAAGIVFAVVITRSLITAVIFSGIGFGVITVAKNFVPELYEILSGASGSAEFEEASNVVNGSAEFSEMDGSGSAPEKDDSGFTGFDDSSYEKLSSVTDQGLNSELNVSAGKMGKHIIMSDQFNGYEPKIIADAVRTMMSKDKE